jgi:hypothetical protein
MAAEGLTLLGCREAQLLPGSMTFPPAQPETEYEQQNQRPLNGDGAPSSV